MRRIAKEHNVDISQLRGTGAGGRVTQQDILDFIDQELKVEETGPHIVDFQAEIAVSQKREEVALNRRCVHRPGHF